MTDHSINPNDNKNPQGTQRNQRQVAPDFAIHQTANMGNAFFNQFWKSGYPMMSHFNDLAALHKGAATTVIRSGEALSKRLEEINQHMMTALHDSIEANAAAAKAMLNVKTVNDLFTLQSEWIRHSVERTMADATKFSGWSVMIAKEISQPVQDHYKESGRTFGKAA